MKTSTLPLLLVVTLFFSSNPLLADGGGAPVAKCVLVLSPEIDCPACEDGIKHVLATAHGVQSADVDVLTNKVVVRYDPARISVKALVGRIAVMGYTAKEEK